MIFPFSLRSAENWLDFVPRFLLSLSKDSPWVDHEEFLQYLATKLQEYFIPSPNRFIPMILSILQTGTDAGKFVLIQVLLRSVATWQFLAEESRLQPLLTEMALSPDEIYSKAATELSSRLEETFDSKGESETMGGLFEAVDKSVSLKEERKFTPESLSTLWDESGAKRGDQEMEEESDDMVEPMRRETLASPPKPPAPPPSSITPKPPAHLKPPGAPASPKPSAPPPSSVIPPPPSNGAIPAPQPPPVPISARSRGAPSKKKRKPVPEPSPDMSDPSPMGEAFLSSQPTSSSDEFVADKLSPAPDALPTSEPAPIAVPMESMDDQPEISEKEESSEQVPPPRTIHTHLHYFSRMNPRKTYPFTVTLSSRAKEIKRDKTHVFSGEQETEIRDEFQLIEPTQQIHVEPLLSGCLVQPTYQRVDIEPQNFPKELVFFVTPLVDPGLRATTLTGKVYIRNERGTLLQEMSLPKLSVSSHRFGQAIASLGTLAGGALPALDFLFGAGLQTTLAAQLAFVLPTLAETISMEVVVIALEVFVFVGALALGGLWWLRKGRAKLAPTHKGALNLPS